MGQCWATGYELRETCDRHEHLLRLGDTPMIGDKPTSGGREGPEDTFLCPTGF